MNAKRQTVWLVSMLSLMVVLSAYYLFTEDVNKLDPTKEAGQTQGIKVDSTVVTPPDVAKKSDAATTDKATASAAKDSVQKSGTKITETKSSDAKVADSLATTTTQKTDAQVLQQVQTQGKSGTDYFYSQQMKRNDAWAKQTQDLLTIITDAKQNTDALSRAYDDLRKIEYKQGKLNNIEATLGKDYHNAFVAEEDSKWKIVVQGKLERSQAVSIVDLVMKELNVGPEKIVVQTIAL